MTKDTWSPDDQRWLNAQAAEGPPPDPYQSWRGPGIFGKPFGVGPGVPRQPSVILAPDEPTIEEIAHAANSGFLPLKHRAAYAKAKAEKRAVLVKEGRETSECPHHSEETLMALAQIKRIGTGR